MQLVERHLIRKDDPRFAVIDKAAFASKNLSNQANYQIRQSFIHEGKYLPYAEIFHRLKQHECYQALPRKVSNSILIQLHKNWVGFFEALKAYQQDPSPFTGRPKLPGYKDKEFLGTPQTPPGGGCPLDPCFSELLFQKFGVTHALRAPQARGVWRIHKPCQRTIQLLHYCIKHATLAS